MAKIGNYQVPDQIADTGWTGGAKCACNGLLQLKFTHADFKHYELHFAPALAASGKCTKLKRYGANATVWFNPAALQNQMDKIKAAQI